MGLSRKLYELFRRVNTVEEFPQWVALGVFDKGAPPPFAAARQTDYLDRLEATDGGRNDPEDEDDVTPLY